MNPCPCGYLGETRPQCSCTQLQIEAYRKKLSGPLLDRIDLRLVVPKISHEHFFDTKSLKNIQHSKVLKLVLIAREAQKKRYNRSDFYNAYASVEHVKTLFHVTQEAKTFLNSSSKKLNLTSRGYLRVLRVARTIADLENSEELRTTHVAEALQFR
jgi:magnesium chelatase family protein